MQKRMARGSALLLGLCLVLILSLCLQGNAVAAEDAPVVDNGIPVVYLRIDESQGTIEDMMNSPDHSIYCYGKLTIDVPEGFHYSDFPDLACVSFADLDMSIRGRGNSTWRESKRPFKIKLDKKADLFGLGKNKHWVLVANAMDASLMKDRLTAWLGNEMGFPFTPRGVPVDVVMIGEEFGAQYLGSYYFSENVRVDANRVDIAELTEEDTDPAAITGGYLLQNSAQVRLGSPDTFYTSRGANWATHTPSFDTEAASFLKGLANASDENLAAAEEAEDGEEAFTGSELGNAYKNNDQQQYIQDAVQHFEDVLFDEGTAYRDLMDVESAAKYWLINQISRNGDAYATGSTYLYKDRDPEDGVSKFYWGPLWDFDFAWNHSSYTQGFEYGHLWCKPMLYDSGEGGFLQEVHKQWPVMRDALLRLIEDGGVMDQYYEETKASAVQDYLLRHPDAEDYDYRKPVEALKTWIRDRIDWVDAHFDELDTMIHKVTFLADGEVWKTDFRAENEPVEPDEQHPEPEDRTFVAWVDEQGKEVDSKVTITEDRVFTAKFVNDSEITHGKDIALVKAGDVIHYNPFFHTVYQIEYEVLPTDADNRAVTWTTSDASIATVDSEGRVYYSAPGEVTLTAALKHGTTRTFTLAIVEGEPDYAQAIKADQDAIRMAVGDQRPCTITTTPESAKLSDCTYVSEDPKIVTVDEFGALTAVAPGETKVKITAESHDEAGEKTTLEAVVTVTVTEKAPEYTITPAGELTWQKASKEDLKLTVQCTVDDETSFDRFTGVKLDGQLLEQDKDYTVERGSTIVTLAEKTLQRLNVGDHTLEVLFTDGQAKAALKIQPAGNGLLSVGSGTAASGSGSQSTTSGSTSSGRTSPVTVSRSTASRGTPRTGDDRSPVWFALAGFSLVCFGLAWSSLRRREE